VPGYRGKVKRATDVTIKGYDLHGKQIRFRADDLLAHAFQHEYDHLEGILYIDRLKGPLLPYEEIRRLRKAAKAKKVADWSQSHPYALM
jgi:peptide deformylase